MKDLRIVSDPIFQLKVARWECSPLTRFPTLCRSAVSLERSTEADQRYGGGSTMMSSSYLSCIQSPEVQTAILCEVHVSEGGSQNV